MTEFAFAKHIQIGDKTIGSGQPVFIIAEAGVNHNGSMEKARQLIDVAAHGGADAVKFQAFKTESLILDHVDKAPYQKEQTGHSESQFEMLKKLEINRAQNRELMQYAEQKKILFLTTPFDEDSLDELDELNLPAYKIASTDTTNLPFLKRIAAKGKPLILSTGMSYFAEVQLALDEIAPINNQVVLLQCTANYPLRDEEANLNVIKTYQEHFEMPIGYSDHTTGIGASPFAVPMGACVVEKHFTLDTSEEGPDHSASLNPQQLADYVQLIRKVEKYMGTSVKMPSFDETQTRPSLQKCLVAKRDIKKGERFTEEMLVAKRTGGKGISPLYYKDLLACVAKRDFLKNEIIVHHEA